MNAIRFDTLSRSLMAGSSRRTVLGGWAATLGVLVLSRSEPVTAKKSKRKKRLRFNQFGCVDVGGTCRGNSDNCCSGICEGKRPKKGKKDKSRCVGHDATSCGIGDTLAFCGGTDVGCTTSSGDMGDCATTTGNAPFCQGDGACLPCTKDADCIAQCGLKAACVVCPTSVCLTGGISTLCVSPEAGGCSDFPV
jgi:hypothetical protein